MPNNFKANPLGVDPDVKVPEAVRRASEAADAAQRRANGQPDPQPQPEPVVTPEVAQPQPQPQVTEPVATQQPDPQPQPQVTEQSWEHRYNSLKPRFDVLNNQNRQLTDRIHNLEQLIETMQTAPAPAPAPQLPTIATQNLITDKEREEFGPEMLDIIGRRAQEVVGQTLEKYTGPLLAQIEQLKGQLGQTQSTVVASGRDRMLADLTSEMPDWREVNMLDEFKTWLALPDPYSGVIRHKTLLEAFEQNNTPRVLAFFKGFSSEQAATSPAPTLAQPPATPAAPKPKLADFAAPGRAGGAGATPAPAGEQPITQGQIREFYAGVRKGGVYTEEEKLKYEQMIFRAQREGRVVP